MVKKKNKRKKEYKKIDKICPRCGEEMIYVCESIGNKLQSEYYECSITKCGHIVMIGKRKMTETKTTTIYTKRVPNVDTSEPVRKYVIPKFKNEFYFVSSDATSKTFYNPVMNVLRIEGEVLDNIKRNSLLSLLTANIVGTIENRNGDN